MPLHHATERIDSAPIRSECSKPGEPTYETPVQNVHSESAIDNIINSVKVRPGGKHIDTIDLDIACAIVARPSGIILKGQVLQQSHGAVDILAVIF